METQREKQLRIDAEFYRARFAEGAQAYQRGCSNGDNPYTECGDVEAWNDGWFDAMEAAQEASERFGEDF